MDILNIHTLYRIKHPSIYYWDPFKVWRDGEDMQAIVTE